MRFIGIATLELEVVAYCAVDVAMERNAFLPVALPVFVATVLVMFGDLQHCCWEISEMLVRETGNHLYELELVPAPYVLVDTNEQGVFLKVSHYIER